MKSRNGVGLPRCSWLRISHVYRDVLDSSVLLNIGLIQRSEVPNPYRARVVITIIIIVYLTLFMFSCTNNRVVDLISQQFTYYYLINDLFDSSEVSK